MASKQSHQSVVLPTIDASLSELWSCPIRPSDILLEACGIFLGDRSLSLRLGYFCWVNLRDSVSLSIFISGRPITAAAGNRREASAWSTQRVEAAYIKDLMCFKGYDEADCPLS